jgi:uncharacterized membrane protein
MTPGLPGTGIGGLFYLLLVVFMPLRETFRNLRGVRDGRRWPVIGGLLALAACIFTALWLEAWVLYQVLGLRSVSLGVSAEQAGVVARAASVATLASLALVLVVIALLRLLVRRPAPGTLRCAVVTRAPAPASMEAPVGPQLDPAGHRRRDLLSA